MKLESRSDKIVVHQVMKGGSIEKHGKLTDHQILGFFFGKLGLTFYSGMTFYEKKKLRISRLWGLESRNHENIRGSDIPLKMKYQFILR